MFMNQIELRGKVHKQDKDTTILKVDGEKKVRNKGIYLLMNGPGFRYKKKTHFFKLSFLKDTPELKKGDSLTLLGEVRITNRDATVLVHNFSKN